MYKIRENNKTWKHEAQYVFICKIKTATRYHAIIHGVPFRIRKIPMNHHVGLDLQEDKIQSDLKKFFEFDNFVNLQTNVFKKKHDLENK